MNVSVLRTRWAAVGAAVAITMGAGGIGVTNALTTSGEKPVYIPIEPCRLADLRPAPNTVGPRTTGLGPSETYTLDGWGAVGNCTLPANTAGLALNVTAVGATTLTNLRFFPTGTPVPLTANLNPSPGAPPTPNAVNVDLNGAGKFSVFNKFGTVAVVIDVMGYYDDHNHDDRYYTKTEVDALTAPLFVVVASDGTIYNGISSGVTSVAKTSTGSYTVTFNRNVNECVPVASDFVFATARDVSVDADIGAVNQVLVVIRNASTNALEDSYFNMIVQC